VRKGAPAVLIDFFCFPHSLVAWYLRKAVYKFQFMGENKGTKANRQWEISLIGKNALNHWIFALKTGERKPLSISTEIIPGITILNLSVITLMCVIIYNLYQVCFFRFIRLFLNFKVQFFKKANFSFHFCVLKGNTNTLRGGYGIKLSSSKQCYSYFCWAFPNNSCC